MKNRKLSSKAVISLILSAVLFTMPAVAFSVNGNYAISAFAEETKETEESKPEESTEQTPGESETDVSTCLLYASPSPRDVEESRMPSSA